MRATQDLVQCPAMSDERKIIDYATLSPTIPWYRRPLSLLQLFVPTPANIVLLDGAARSISAAQHQQILQQISAGQTKILLSP